MKKGMKHMNKKLTRKLVAVLMALTMVMSLFAVSLVSAEDAAPAAQAPAAAASETPAAETPSKADETPSKADDKAKEEDKTKEDESTTKKEEPTTQPAQEDPAPAEDPQPAPTPALYPEDVYWVKKINKQWVLVANKNSTERVNETGVFRNENGWWRVEKGVVNFKATGLYQNSFGEAFTPTSMAPGELKTVK